MFCYCRKLFHASDGGTFALDWLLSADGNTNFYVVNLAFLSCYLYVHICIYLLIIDILNIQ